MRRSSLTGKVLLMNNKEIAEIFAEIADILEIKNENFFRVRAYRGAARTVENLTEELSVLIKANDFKLPGIGEDLKAKIREMVDTGGLVYYEKLKKTIAPGLLQIMGISGIGPKRTKLLYDKLKIDSIAKLERAAKAHKICSLAGFKEKSEENILKGIELLRQKHERMLLSGAREISSRIIARLKPLKEVLRISAAGSLRRARETVRDIDILISSASPENIMKSFSSLAGKGRQIAKGETKSAILTDEGVQVDLRVVSPESYGAALVYFTGSKEHNVRIRELAKKTGLKINEYGVFEEKTEKKIAGKSEEDVYRALGLDYIAPELRENKGEIEAAGKNALPDLVELKNIRADLHLHTDWSDGTDTLETMARAAQARGYEYIVISDHSQGLGVAGGLSPERLAQQITQIRRLNKRLKGFRILCGSEVDIKADGSLDFDPDVLQSLDVVLAAIHSGFKQSRDQITHRLVTAMKSGLADIVVHPSGRLINERPAYEFDYDAVLAAARDTNTALEINCYPKRLDLDDNHVRRAKQAGVRICLGTDSHRKEQLANMELGVAVARRGWLEKKNLLNCLSLKAFLKQIEK